MYDVSFKKSSGTLDIFQKDGYKLASNTQKLRFITKKK